MQELETSFVWMDGELVPWNDARVHILTHSLHYGLGVFEGTRAYKQIDGGTAVFRLDDHVRRLGQSAKIVNIKLPFDELEIVEATLDLIRLNGHDSCYIRHLVYIGAGIMGLHPGDNPIRSAISTWNWGAYLGEEGLERGIRCKISSYTRHFPNSGIARAKATGNYITSTLAKREAVRDGYDEAILLDTRGLVTEGTGENLFIVRDGKLKTPPPTAFLEGITWRSVMELAERLGIEVVTAELARDELYIADEVFLTGTAAEITPVREIDNRPIGSGSRGPVTHALQESFFQAIAGGIPEFKRWLTPVREATSHEESSAVEAPTVSS